ncbi:uncharacterized protein LOC131680839 [Topomyia yanbarensis]|uniref:uncharacterized protein LOC131680839 n=1 Tax=Topomyia yanbarensis TaxID=2498891 RepID=UPI00273C22A0|nr:uncharacterized protein LOC131680839 [Topomyia yanbarensis]
MVNRRLTTWLEDEKLLDPRQFAFRKGSGTEAHLGSLGEVLDRARSEGIHADIAILDIAKAYNTVWREGVLQQFQRWGIQGNLGVFIQNFLTNRRFRVCIGGTLSDEFREANGVPQGSNLTVTLFLVRMNSLFTALPGGVYVFVYADDIILVALGKTIPRTRIVANAVGRWALATGFNIAATKCTITHCCSTYHPANARPIRLNGTVIPFRKEPVVLGITLDRKLTMIPHFRRLKKDCQSRNRLVRTICAHHPKNIRRAALNVGRSLIHSRIFYGIEMTSRNLDGLSDILGPLIHGAVRLAAGLLPSTPAEAACAEAGVLPCRWETARVAFRRALGFLEKTSGDECPLLTTASNLHQEFTSNDLPPIARLHRLINRRYSHHTKIFTSGSKANDGVGAGIGGLGNGLSFRLPPSSSVFSAEAAAIAVGMIKRPTDTPTVIFTNSLSVLRDVASEISKHRFVQAIETLRDPLVTICWVPSHSGNKGNTDADRLALIGRRARTRLPNETPTIDIDREFNTSLQNGFTNHWRSSRNHIQKIKGSADTWTDRNSQREQKILSRHRVGQTRVTHAHTVSTEPVPKYSYCNTRLTVEHLLCNCRELEDLRRQYGLTGPIRDTLSNDPFIAQLRTDSKSTEKRSLQQLGCAFLAIGSARRRPKLEWAMEGDPPPPGEGPPLSYSIPAFMTSGDLIDQQTLLLRAAKDSEGNSVNLPNPLLLQLLLKEAIGSDPNKCIHATKEARGTQYILRTTSKRILQKLLNIKQFSNGQQVEQHHKSLPTPTPSGEVPALTDEPPAAVGVGPSVPFRHQATHTKRKNRLPPFPRATAGNCVSGPPAIHKLYFKNQPNR